MYKYVHSIHTTILTHEYFRKLSSTIYEKQDIKIITVYGGFSNGFIMQQKTTTKPFPSNSNMQLIRQYDVCAVIYE